MIPEGLFDANQLIEPAGMPEQPLSGVPSCRGVLLFADADARPVQLLTAANLRRTAIARLYPDKPADALSRKADITAITRSVHWRCSHNPLRTSLDYLRIARTLYPDTYRTLLNIAPPNCIAINMSADWPDFRLSHSASPAGAATTYGLFPSRKSAAEFIAILRDAFGLCRRSDLIDSPDKAAACPYLQMTDCPAPCVGRISRDEYLQRIGEAVAAARGEMDAAEARLQAEMQGRAAAMQYEHAAAARQRLERLRGLKADAYRWVAPLRELAILHIDRSARVRRPGAAKAVQTYAAFLIRGGPLIDLGDFAIDGIPALRARLTDALAQPPITPEPLVAADQLAVVAYHLFRSRPQGHWLKATESLPSGDAIRQLLCEDAHGGSGMS